MQIRRWMAKDKSWHSHDEKRKGSLNMKLRCKTDPILRSQGCKEYYAVLLLSGCIGESPKGLVKSRTIGEPYRAAKLTLFSWSRNIEYVKLLRIFAVQP